MGCGDDMRDSCVLPEETADRFEEGEEFGREGEEGQGDGEGMVGESEMVNV